jgi:hypothetical protein
MNECFQFVDLRRRRGHGQRPSAAIFEEICKDFAASNSLAGVECLKGDRSSWNERDRQRNSAPLPDEFLDQVNALLPAQPWPYGVHLEVADKLEVAANKVQRAIGQLMKSRRRIKQVDGLLYDGAGNVMALQNTKAGRDSLD